MSVASEDSFKGQRVSHSSLTFENTSLNDFDILREIGRGLYSVVYKATCRKSGKNVALKKVQICEMKDAKAREDCKREIGLLQQLDHSNVIKYFASFIENTELHLVLELAEAGDLAQVIQHFKQCHSLMPESTIWTYFVQICSALRHMHDKRVLHRDIKPSNVFITDKGIIKLGDLGLGRYFSQNTYAAQSLVGTPYYMSPERIQGSLYNFRSDIWSLGCLLYEMAALQSPFYGEKTNLYSLSKKIELGEYPPLPSDIYSDEIRRLISECINPVSERRPDIKHVHEVALRNCV